MKCGKFCTFIKWFISDCPFIRTNRNFRKFTASSTGLNKIGKEAFSGDKKLANITLKTTKLKKSGVGKDAFKNIKKNATFKVPAKKVSDYKAIFKSKGAGKNIR